MNRTADLVVALCAALLGIFVLWAAQDVRPASIADPIGSKGAPRFAGGTLVVGGLVLIFRRLRNWSPEGRMVPAEGVEDDPGVPPGSVFRALSIWTTAMLYVLLLPSAGYLIATPVMLVVVLLLFSVRRKLILLGVAIGFTIPVFLVFVLFLNIRLPAGILDEFLRQAGLL